MHVGADRISMHYAVPAKAGTQGNRASLALDPGFRRGDEESCKRRR
jgi:hypothetical protein